MKVFSFPVPSIVPRKTDGLPGCWIRREASIDAGKLSPELFRDFLEQGFLLLILVATLRRFLVKHRFGVGEQGGHLILEPAHVPARVREGKPFAGHACLQRTAFLVELGIERIL